MITHEMLVGSIAGTLAGIGWVIAAFIALIIGWKIHPYTVSGFIRWIDSPLKQFMARIGTSIGAAATILVIGFGNHKNPDPNLEQTEQPSASVPSLIYNSSAKNIEASAIGEWRINIDKSPLDNSKIVKGSLDADSLVKMSFHTERPILNIHYSEGELQASISFQSSFRTDTTEVATRFGKDAPTTEAWGVSTDHKTIFVPGESAAFVKKLNSSETLVVRVADSNC